MLEKLKHKLNALDKRRVAEKAGVTYRTVDNYLNGLGNKPTTAKAILAAATEVLDENKEEKRLVSRSLLIREMDADELVTELETETNAKLKTLIKKQYKLLTGKAL